MMPMSHSESRFIFQNRNQESCDDDVVSAAKLLMNLGPNNESSPPPRSLSCHEVPRTIETPYPVISGSEASFDESEDEEWSVSSTFFTGSVSLALDDDPDHLSPLHCFMRKYCVEAFSAGEEDVMTPRHGRSLAGRVVLGQVGVRCLHCKHRATKQERAMCFPSSIQNIYHSIETWQRRHSVVCEDLPTWIKVKLLELMKESKTGAGGRRKYWEESAKRLGMADTKHGIRFIRAPGDMGSLDDDSSFSSMAQPPAKSIPVVFHHDRQLVTEYLFTLIDQMEICYFSEEDRVGGRSKVKDCPIGFPGMQCKHCRGRAGFGRYYPSTFQALTSANSDRNMFNHLMKCRRCPSEIQNNLSQLHVEHQENKNRRGTRKALFDRVWRRLHGENAFMES